MDGTGFVINRRLYETERRRHIVISVYSTVVMITVLDKVQMERVIYCLRSSHTRTRDDKRQYIRHRSHHRPYTVTNHLRVTCLLTRCQERRLIVQSVLVEVKCLFLYLRVLLYRRILYDGTPRPLM